MVEGLGVEGLGFAHNSDNSGAACVDSRLAKTKDPNVLCFWSKMLMVFSIVDVAMPPKHAGSNLRFVLPVTTCRA